MGGKQKGQRIMKKSFSVFISLLMVLLMIVSTPLSVLANDTANNGLSSPEFHLELEGEYGIFEELHLDWDGEDIFLFDFLDGEDIFFLDFSDEDDDEIRIEMPPYWEEWDGFVDPEYIYIPRDEFTLDEGIIYQIYAYAYPPEAGFPEVTWSSSDESVATIDSDGVIHALSEGTTVFTAQLVDGELTASITLFVVPVPLGIMPLSSRTISMTAGTGGVWHSVPANWSGNTGIVNGTIWRTVDVGRNWSNIDWPSASNLRRAGFSPNIPNRPTGSVPASGGTVTWTVTWSSVVTPPFLTISTQGALTNLPAAGGSQINVTVNTNTDWQLVGRPTWLEISNFTSSGFRLTTTRNTGGARPPVTIIVRTLDGSITRSFSVSQQGVQNHTVQFHANGGRRVGGGNLTQTIIHGQNATLPSVVRDHHEFNGWSPSNGHINVINGRTITAQWTRIRRTISINAGTGATWAASLPTGWSRSGTQISRTVDAGTSWGSIPWPTAAHVSRPGHTMSHFPNRPGGLVPDFGGTNFNVEWVPVTRTVDITLPPGITRVSGGQLHQTPSGGAAIAQINLATQPGFTMPLAYSIPGGLSFTRGSPTTASIIGTPTANINHTVTAPVPITYMVQLDRNGGSGGSTSFTVQFGSNVMTGYSNPIQAGFTFDGYWSAATGGVQVISPQGQLVSALGFTNAQRQWTRTTTPTTLVAQWIQDAPVQRTLTFNAGGGTWNSVPPQGWVRASNTQLTRTINVGENWNTVDWPRAEHLAPRAGFTPANITPAQPPTTGSVPPSGTDTWTFGWTEVPVVATFTITLHPNGGIGSQEQHQVNSGENFTIPSPFTREGHNFTGWNTQANGNGTPHPAGGTINNVTQNWTLHAQWEPIGDNIANWEWPLRHQPGETRPVWRIVGAYSPPGHIGVDIRHYNDPPTAGGQQTIIHGYQVRAAHGGEVLISGLHGGGGFTVVIRSNVPHNSAAGHYITSRYLHLRNNPSLAPTHIASGDDINQGRHIGFVGDTGQGGVPGGTGVLDPGGHLHFDLNNQSMTGGTAQINAAGAAINPLNIFPNVDVVSRYENRQWNDNNGTAEMVLIKLSTVE